MDAQTRHQLKQNELAEALDRLRRVSDRRTIYFVVAIALILVLYIGWKWSQSASRATLAQKWDQLETATVKLDSMIAEDVSAARTTLEEFAGDRNGAVSCTARLWLARWHVGQAFKSAASRESSLAAAAALLEPIRTTNDTSPSLKAAALFALASVYESQMRVEDARGLYTELSGDAYAGSPYQALAQDRLEDIDELREPITFEPGSPPVPPPPTTLPSLPPATQPAPPAGDGAAPAGDATTGGEEPVPPDAQPPPQGDEPAGDPDAPSEPSAEPEPDNPAGGEPSGGVPNSP